MAWRVISIENPAALSFRNNNLIIKQDEEVFFPLEDIDTLVLDSYGITISQNLISELSKNNVNTIICDEKHHPSAMLISYSQASRGTKNAKAQIELPESTRKQLWRKNIIQKITNQAKVLEKFGHQNSDLLELAKTVRSGDVSNNESIAARLYFERLLEDSTRRKPVWHNSALNYAYAILRSSIAKSIAARGLIANIGINHRSELNQYNLADDIIECFRPIADLFILQKVAIQHIGEESDENLNREDRHAILDILNQNVIIIDKKYKVKNAIDRVVESFLKAILEDSISEFILPEII